MDIRLGYIATFLTLDDESKFKTKIPATAGRFCLIGAARNDRTGRKDIEDQAKMFSGFSMISNEPEEVMIGWSPGSRHSVYNNEKHNEAILKTLKIESFVPSI